MTTHASILAWRIPRTEEPDRLQSTVSQRVGHDESNSAGMRAPWMGVKNHSFEQNDTNIEEHKIYYLIHISSKTVKTKHIA